MASKTKIPVKIKLDTRDHELREVFLKFTSLQYYLFCGLVLCSMFSLRNFLTEISVLREVLNLAFSILVYETHLITCFKITCVTS